MADPITWYALGRTVIDTESILEAVDAKILTHNLDASAHGQENESLYEHRAAALLDHLSYSIYNIKTNPAARVYKAIVGSGLEADFEALQAAIDWTNLYGGGTIFIKAKTYTLTSDITLYNNIEIVGEDNDTCIFDFNSGAYQFKLIGTSGTHKKNCWLRNIQIKNSHKGNLGAINWQYVNDSGIENCKFSGNVDPTFGDGAAITVDNCLRLSIKDNFFDSDNLSIQTFSCTHITIEGNHISSASWAGIYVSGGSSNFIFNNLVSDSAAAAILVELSNLTQVIGNFVDTFTSYGITTFENEASDYLIISNNVVINGAVNSAGIYIALGSKYCSITGNVLKNNATHGITLLNGDRNTITGNVVTGGSKGIELDANSDRNVCSSNILIGSTTPLTNSGTNNLDVNNIKT
jgi:parallel beta-helix repeat protein